MMPVYNPKYLIVIGCSAGGVKAICKLLSQWPISESHAIVIVQHIAEDSKDMAEIISMRLHNKVQEAEDKQFIAANSIYLAPPGYHLLIEEDKSFSLSFDEKVKFSRPSIDVLFKSAAECYQTHLIAMILTGTNNDGSLGVKAVKEYGGLTIAQNPNEAEYSYMPQAGINTGCIDYILDLENIINTIQKITSHHSIWKDLF